jgi:hypothetical protein
VNTDVPEGNSKLVGVPAREASENTSVSLLNEAQRSLLLQSDVRSSEYVRRSENENQRLASAIQLTRVRQDISAPAEYA